MINFYLLSKGCTYYVSYKKQPLLLSLGGCPEEKKYANKWDIIKK